ncbi:2-oxoglutarate dehydrogenase E1 component, partial [bacterium]|nr:2-oxoglutarate dehydrogenase E1 component [bacterium]
MTDFSYLGNADPAAIEGYYQQYRQQPESVDASWRKFFEGFEFARTANGVAAEQAPEQFIKEVNVLNLIGAYRQRGHLFTKTNPVRTRRQYGGKLTLENFELDESDLDTVFHAGARLGLGPAALRDIVQMLEETYCHSVGVEYKFIRDPKVMEWLQERMESCRNRLNYSKDQKLRMLRKLMQAVTLEKFMHARFVGQKRFSLEGLEVFIPAMEAIVEIGAYFGVREFLVGMAHRGRLNMLTNILGKGYQHIFWEFEGKALDDHLFMGDVKYHLGHSADRVTHNGKSVHLSLAPNPSHLEAIDPVVEGLARAKLDNLFNGDLKKVLPILVHGDSSIAGQGIVYELLQMSQLEGYQTGGTMHIVLNNQVGFTTNYIEARSSTYCTDVAKTTLSPVFHVNADDVEAVCYVVQVALEFRQRFHRDVFIDILGYRKHGHNEGDEPRFTQPILYKAIAKHPDPFAIYSEKLISEDVIDAAYAKQIAKEFRAELDEAYEKAMTSKTSAAPSFLTDRWAELRFSNKEDFRESPHTGVSIDELQRIGTRINQLPADKKFFSKVEKIYADRRAMMENGEQLDWASGELLAYATLLEEGFRVRISGQDSRRGTFSHRHAMLRVEDTELAYFPLQNISEQQAPFEIYNSPLSEYGVLGFETGYAMATPDALVVWEAQFGDFFNGAQIIIDQFITGSEAKWKRGSGLVMLLPHGLEGQGPEHSSGRMERFLAECAETNMQVANITTPANFFHALRRQLHRPFRTPLIVMSPKSLLRHPQCVSPLRDFDKDSRFHEVFDDPNAEPKAVKRVLLCTGKLYYELLKRQQDEKRNDVAIIRIEQLYPLPKYQLENIVKRYANAKEHFWVQEEPENMG